MMELDNAEMEQVVMVVKATRRPSAGETRILDALALIHPERQVLKKLSHQINMTPNCLRVAKHNLNKKIDGTGLKVASRTHSGYWLEYSP